MGLDISDLQTLKTLTRTMLLLQTVNARGYAVNNVDRQAQLLEDDDDTSMREKIKQEDSE
jgi:hypothetical protein